MLSAKYTCLSVHKLDVFKKKKEAKLNNFHIIKTMAKMQTDFSIDAVRFDLVQFDSNNF